MKLCDFDYDLPENLIAKTPLSNRDSSRLMHVEKSSGSTSHHQFSDIYSFLQSGDVLVLNDTKVIKARLKAKRKTGASIEVFLISEQDDGSWLALIKPAKRVAINERLIISDDFQLTLEKKSDSGCHIRLHCEGSVYEALETYGYVPIPPYLQSGQETPTDHQQQYQTVFAQKEGAVAAPTAGLHFTDALLNDLKAKGVQIETITLHVGYGTFQPITVENYTQHTMHYERYFIADDVAARLNESLGKRRIIAVGTTVVRTLESAFTQGRIRPGLDQTNLFLTPGSPFNVVQALITNFHLPRSSLLLLVSAFAGSALIKQAYEEAVRLGYRFYSFGDAMFIE